MLTTMEADVPTMDDVAQIVTNHTTRHGTASRILNLRGITCFTQHFYSVGPKSVAATHEDRPLQIIDCRQKEAKRPQLS